MLYEHSSGVTEVRPGRPLFSRCLLVGTESIAETSAVVFCVHGTMGSCAQFEGLWEPLSEALSASKEPPKLAIWMFDSLGCGQSPVPGAGRSASDVTDAEIEKDINAIITDNVDTSKPVVFLAHSYGPQTVLKLVRDYPLVQKAVAGYVFCNTGFLGSHPNLINGGPPLFKLPVCILDCIQPMLTRSFLKLAFSPSAKPEVLEAAKRNNNKNDMTMCRYYYGAHNWLTGEEAKQILVPVIGAKPDHEKRNGTVPCTVLHGVDDQLIPIECGNDVSNTLGASSLVVVEKAGHEIFEEQPQFVAQQIARFLLEEVLHTK